MTCITNLSSQDGGVKSPRPHLTVAEFRHLVRAGGLALDVLHRVEGPGAVQEASRQFAFELTPAAFRLRRVALALAARSGLDPVAVAQVWAAVDSLALPPKGWAA